jgi:translation initiation factor 2A
MATLQFTVVKQKLGSFTYEIEHQSEASAKSTSSSGDEPKTSSSAAAAASMSPVSKVRLVERNDLHRPRCSEFVYSSDGELVAFKDVEGVSIVDTASGEERCRLTVAKCVVMCFSPGGNYFETWHHMPRAVAGSTVQGNLVVWRLDTGEALCRFVQKQFSKDIWPMVQWSRDDRYAAKTVSSGVHVFDAERLDGAPIARIAEADARQISWSPDVKQHKLCVFVPEKKSKPASAKLHAFPLRAAPLARLSMYNAADVGFQWNVHGNSLLLTTHTDFDSSGRSYYGRTSLYHLSAQYESCKVPLPESGAGADGSSNNQVYFSTWKPNGRHFVAIYGYPARATVFNQRCAPAIDFGEAPRNTAIWQPHAQLMLLAGFGSLQGFIDVWCPAELKRIGRATDHGAKYCEWAPDSRLFLTAVTTTGLQVDNGFKLWDYAGRLVLAESVDKLDAICWRPAPWRTFAKPDLGPLAYLSDAQLDERAAEATRAAGGKVAPKAVGKYRHPNAAAHSPSASLGAASSVHKPQASGPKRYAAPRGGAGRGRGTGGAAGAYKSPGARAPRVIPGDTGNDPALAGAERRRRKRLIGRKLRQIESLKQMRDEQGKSLDRSQLAKIATEESLRKELTQLNEQK